MTSRPPSATSWFGRVAQRLRGTPPPPPTLPGLLRTSPTPVASPSIAAGAMDVKAFASPEERLLLLERACRAWRARVEDEPAARDRRSAARARAGARAVAGPVLLIGADRGWATSLRAEAESLTVVDLAPEARVALAGLGDGGPPVDVRPHAWLLHALEEAPFAHAVLPAWSVAATSPPLAAELLRMAAHVLRRDGLLWIEAAVHRDGHTWRARTELADEAQGPARHVLPATDVFASLAAERCVPVDVREVAALPGEVVLTILARRTR